MEIELKGLSDLKQAVDDMREVGTRLGMFAKTMMMAADKMDEALSAHIAAMTNFMEHQNFLEQQRREREDLAAIGRTHGLSSTGT